ncbi:MAG: kinase [Novosphingobium sp.]|nr:kinase [Novosphingobium sp.]
MLDLAVQALASRQSWPVVIGLCGAQGSGKSTLARAVQGACEARGIPAAILSIDDLYLTRLQRAVLARTVHPLFETRGPPGTHDIALGERVLDALARGEGARLPRFDKAFDDRLPKDDWPLAPRNCSVLLLEGWCVGARPQEPTALVQPVNALEQLEDRLGIWRRYVNAALAGPYRRFFARIDRLAMLAAPDFEIVLRWRLQQEEELRLRVGPEGGRAVMDTAQIARFIQHYERLTRFMLVEMPARADLVIRIDEERRPVEITVSR